MTHNSEDLLERLTSAGALTSCRSHLVRRFAKRWGCSLSGAVIETHTLSEQEFADSVARVFGLERIYHIKLVRVERTLCERIPFDVARRFSCLPIAINGPEANGSGGGILDVCVADPTLPGMREELYKCAGSEMTFSVADFSELRLAIYDTYCTLGLIAFIPDEMGI